MNRPDTVTYNKSYVHLLGGHASPLKVRAIDSKVNLRAYLYVRGYESNVQWVDEYDNSPSVNPSRDV